MAVLTSPWATVYESTQLHHSCYTSRTIADDEKFAMSFNVSVFGEIVSQIVFKSFVAITGDKYDVSGN